MWCFHDRLKQFTFSNGVTIECCPDCTRYDNKRAEVLRVGKSEMPCAEQRIHWAELLDAAGFPEHIAGNNWLNLAGGLNDLDKNPNVYFVPEYLGDERLWSSWITTIVQPTLKKLYDQRRIDAAKRYTPVDDHEHIERAKPFPHTLSMPRLHKTFCTRCTEVVIGQRKPWVVRLTKGVYLPIDHDCNSVRVYDLKGNLLEVRR